MAAIGQRVDAVKLDRKVGGKAYPDDYNWQCSVCGRWNRAFEGFCPYCRHAAQEPHVVVTVMDRGEYNMAKHTVKRVSSFPQCDFHPGTPAKYDGKTKQGPWANMCEGCFARHGVGLGLGRGQVMVQEPDLVGAPLRERLEAIADE